MFWEILKMNFGNELKADYPSPSYYPLPKEALNWALYQYPYRCFTSHNYNLSSVDTSLCKFDAFAFVRDPVAKFISYYFFNRGIPQTADWHATKTHSFTDYVRLLAENPLHFGFQTDISQQDMLSGITGSSIEIVEESVDAGLLNLFPTEKFDEAMVVLEKKFPTDFKDCSYSKKINTSGRDQKISKEDLDLIEQVSWIEKDRALWNYSQNCLNRAIEENFSSKMEFDALLQQFRDRCLKKSASCQRNFKTKVKSKIKSIIK